MASDCRCGAGAAAATGGWPVGEAGAGAMGGCRTVWEAWTCCGWACPGPAGRAVDGRESDTFALVGDDGGTIPVMVAACAAAGTGAPEPAGIAAADGTPFSPAEAEPVGWEARCWACPGPAGTRGFVVCVADADGWDAEGGNIPVTGVETMDSEAVRLAGSDDGAFGMAAAGPLGVAAFAWDAVTACRWFWTVPSDMAIAAAWAGMGPADACTGCGTGDIPNASTADDGTDALTVDGVCVGCVEPVGCAPFAGPAEPAGAAGEPEDGTPDMAAGAEEPANASTAPLGIEDMDTEPSEDDGIAAAVCMESDTGALD